MKKVVFVVLAALIAVSAMAGVYSDRAGSAMTYITDPINGLYNPAEGLPWVNGDPTAPAAPILDNIAPSYLGSYFYSTAALMAGMHATGVNTGYARNAMERVFIANFDAGTALPSEPWWDGDDSLVMFDAIIPWRLDPAMSSPSSINQVYLERVLWSTYFLTLTGEVEYTPFIAKILRGIRNNPVFFNETTAAIKYNGTDNLYLTALWGLVLESYMRSWELYPVRVSVIDPPVLDYDWTIEAEGAWEFVSRMMGYYFGVTLPDWWARYNSGDFCPIGGIHEAEACGDDDNGGCNYEGGGYPIETIEPNDIICGTLWAYNVEGINTRDTDWYQLTLTEPANVTIRGNSEAHSYLFRLGIDFEPCNAYVIDILEIGPHSEGSLNLGVLPAGTYYFWAGLTVFEGFPCDVNYWMKIETSEPPLMAYSFDGSAHSETPIHDYYLGNSMPDSYVPSMPHASTMAPMAPMDAARGLERWEYLPVMMFAAISEHITVAEDLWNDHFDDVDWTVWRGDVQDYFQTGPIWVNPRGFYEPLHRWPGITSFYDLANLEIYRATLNPIYAEKLILTEGAYWEPNLWDAIDGYYIQSTARNSTVIWNGLHAYTNAHIPTVEITEIWSDLPSEGVFPYDYNANTVQNHSVTVRVTNTGLVPVGSLILRFDEAYTGGIRNGLIPVPVIPVGGYVDVVYNIGAPGLAGDHTIVCDFLASSATHIEYEIIDNDLLINVEDPAGIDIVFSGGSAATAPRNPFLTAGQTFNFEVEILNTGVAPIREVEINLLQTSIHGLAFDFTEGTHFVGEVNIPGGATHSVFFPAIVPMGVGGIGFNDIRVDVNLVRAIDENTRGNIPVGTLTDVLEKFDIQHPPRLTVTNIVATPYWLNAADPVNVAVTIYNEAGDYATADMFDVYDQGLEFVASVIGGIGGADIAATAPVEIAAGATENVTFDIFNDGVTENAYVDVHYTGHYRDGNDGIDPEAEDSPLLGVEEDGMGIDVVPPWINPVAPIAGGAWPADNIAKIHATDNLSGVDFVRIILRRNVGGQFWNFTTGAWGAWNPPHTNPTLAYNALSGYWERDLPNHPTGNYIMYVRSRDVAGNNMDIDYVPIGDVEYVHLVEMFTNLWRGSALAPVPFGADWDYECDWNWVYRCSVMVYNPNAFVVEDVNVNLYSASPHTIITPLGVAQDIPALTQRWFKFTVQAPAYNFIDSLYSHVVEGHYDGGKPIAEQITDNDLRVKVEKPADFVIVDVWVEPDDINNWLGGIGDPAIVTMGQEFRLHALVRNNGTDVIDSVQIFPTQAPNMGTDIDWVVVEPMIYNIAEGDEHTRAFNVTASITESGDCPVQWDQDLVLDHIIAVFTANNHEPGYITGLTSIENDRAPLAIQQHPDLITDGYAVNGVPAPAETTWINMTNSVDFNLWLMNDWAACAGGPPDDDRAAADRLLSSEDYLALLRFWDLTSADPWDHYRTDANILGLNAHTVSSDLVAPGDFTQLAWTLAWDGTYPGTYEGVWWVEDQVFYGDNNYQNQLHANNSPHEDIFPRLMGIDVSRPEVEILWPIDSFFADFPETIIVLAEDAVSGVKTGSVKIQLEDPTGMTYNGTNWGTGDNWFTAYHDITFGDDTFWFDSPLPTEEGCWVYRAYAHDNAGNQSLIEEIDFIYDIRRPDCEIIYPEPGFYSYTATNVWDKRIEVWALDDITVGFDCVSHVKSVYVAIFDRLRGEWWDGPAGWVASGTARWQLCSATADPEVWEYLGYTFTGTVDLEVYSYARDHAGNLGPPCDTLRYIVVDEDKPTSVITDRFDAELPNIWFVDEVDWNADMQNELWGNATDYLTRVDSVLYSVWDSLSDSYWNGAGWVPGVETWNTPTNYRYNIGGWFTPGAPPHADGINYGVGDVLSWRAQFPNPGFGYYRVRSLAYDDLGHEEAGFTTQNEKVLIFDNCAPVVYPWFPGMGAVYYIDDWVDSFFVHAYDSCGFGNDGSLGGPVEKVSFWIMNPRGQYWGWMPVMGWRWLDWAYELTGAPADADSFLWRPNNPPILTEQGTYTMFVRAWDHNGNLRLNAWSWTLTVDGRFISIEALPNDPGRDFFFVDEEFTLRIIAWTHPTVPDISFAHEFFFGDNMPLPENFTLTVPGPYWASRGTLLVAGVCNVPKLGLEVFVDAPTSGLPRASSSPIDIIQLIDADLGGFVMDNPDDQGNFMWLHHNRTKQDPVYGGGDIDTMSVKIQAYHYFRDEDPNPLVRDWQPIGIVGNASTPDSVRLMFHNNNEFTEYEYGMNAEVLVKGVGTVIQTEIISLGIGRPIDNIPPQNIDDLAISVAGGFIRLDWSMAVLGSDDPPTPEINPAVNVVYSVWRFTDPLADLDARALPIMEGITNTWWIDTDLPDPTQPYYYVVKAFDYDENLSPEYSNRVGKVDYQIANGWNSIGYPLGVPGLVSPVDYIAHLGAPIGDIYAYSNVPAGWEMVFVGGFPIRNLADDGSEDLMVWSDWTGMGRWTAGLPEDLEDLNISYDLGVGYNGIMIPLVRGDLAMASDLYHELEANGLNPVTVAQMIPGAGWNSIFVDEEGAVYFDFPIYPGQSYLVWVDSPGIWPEYAGLPRPAFERKAEVGKTIDAIPMPNTCAIPFMAEDNSKIQEVKASVIWGENSYACDIDGNMIKVEFSRFEDIEIGQEVRLEVNGDGGLFVGERMVTVGAEGIHVEPVMVLAKTTPTLPENFALHSNVPNPFNPATSISFDLPERADVDLSIYNIEGRLVRRIVSNEMPAGYHKVVWDGRDETGMVSPAGVYFYQLRAGDFTARRRMMLVK